MKLTLLQKNLKEGLNIVERIALKSATLPILNHVLLEAEGNFLRLSTTDLEMGINWWTLAKVEKEGKIAIPVFLFSNFVGLLPKSNVCLETKNQNLFLESDNIKTQIKGSAAEDFPIIPKIEKVEKATFQGFPFCQGLSQIINIASLSTVRPEISGIYFSIQKNLLKMVATDSFRLGEKKIFLKEGTQIPTEYSFILPQKAAFQVISIFGEKEGFFDIYFSPNLLMFESQMEETEHPKIQLISKLIEGEYPKYEEIIPKTFKTKAILEREEFINQIRIAGIFAGRINVIKLRFDSERKETEIFCQNPDLGSYKSVLPAKIEGKLTEISFNYKFLLDGLLNLKQKEVLFSLSEEKEGEEGPGILKPVGDESYFYVAMPYSD